MKWSEVQVGDILIDEENDGNDHILLGLTDDLELWFRCFDECVEVMDRNINDESTMMGWYIVRGKQTMYSG